MRMKNNQLESPVRLETITITMPSNLIAHLDEISASIRRTSSSALSRSALIRAFVLAIERAYLEFSRCKSEADIALSVTKLLEAGIPIVIGNRGYTTQPPKSASQRPA